MTGSDPKQPEKPAGGGSLVSIKDLFGLEKVADTTARKLLDSLAELARPWLLRRQAKAQAASVLSVLPTLDQAGLVPKSGELTLDERAFLRLSFEAKRRQENYEATVQKAAEIIVENSASNASAANMETQQPDPDWFVQWAKRAQDVSMPELQRVWAKVLAGEIKKPGSFSLRTLNTLSLMTTKEASPFERYARYSSVIFGKTVFIYLQAPDNDPHRWPHYFFGYKDHEPRLKLNGLIYERSSDEKPLFMHRPAEGSIKIHVCGISIEIMPDNISTNPNNVFPLGTYIEFSDVASELVQLTEPARDREYLKVFSERCRIGGCRVIEL